MSLANAAGVLLKPQTPLQQLLEDINFQRTKEMRQLLKDDSGFVVLQGTTYWTDLFVRHFLFQTESVNSIDSDDLLFFVRKKHVKSSSRHMPKYETEVDVFRKDSRKLPIGDPDVDWEETVYLNMVIHQFDYTLTLAICTRTSPKELQVLRRHSQRVYASPSRRKMDTKGEGEEITYPHICFMVDNFDEVFSDILVRDGEMVCVELVANDKDGSVQGVIFLGSIRYDALKKVYDARQSSLSSKVAQRMSFGLFSSGAGVQTRCEFVRMKGPQGKGHAEMAVTKPKGSGVETPTSEPGFCATDMWDDWEEENDDYCTYRHQRRLSDPSANLNNFSRFGWRTKNPQDNAGGAGAKARSENEGLDSLASEVSEIEAGDLRDDLRPAFSASEAKLHLNPNCENHGDAGTAAAAITATTINTSAELISPQPLEDEDDILNCSHVSEAMEATNTTVVTTSPTSNTSTTGCGNCFGNGGKKCKRWVTSSSSSDKNTPQMSEIYCPTCEDAANETPACLNKMPDKKTKPKHKTILSVESELVVGKRGSLRSNETKKKLGGVTRSISLNAADKKTTAATTTKRTESPTNKKDKSKMKEKEKTKNNKDKDKEKSVTKPTTLLAKVSPKRLKLKTTEKPKKNYQQQQLKQQQCKENTNNNAEEAAAEQLQQLDLEDKPEEYEIADDATSLNGGFVDMCDNDRAAAENRETKIAILSDCDTQLMINVRGREELPVVEEPSPPSTAVMQEVTQSAITSTAVAVAANNPYRFEKCIRVPVKSESHPLQLMNDDVGNNKLAAVSTIDSVDFEIIDNNVQHEDNAATKQLLKKAIATTTTTSDSSLTTTITNDCNGNCDAAAPLAVAESVSPTTALLNEGNQEDDDVAATEAAAADGNADASTTTTLPRMKRSKAQQIFYNRALNLVPKRRTPDGTNIYYWCDLSKKTSKELDDGAYNPLWASRGFTQSFHFWKENRRQQSTPLNAFLTYVTLPWWSIAKDLLDHRETPILTF